MWWFLSYCLVFLPRSSCSCVSRRETHSLVGDDILNDDLSNLVREIVPSCWHLVNVNVEKAIVGKVGSVGSTAILSM